MSATHETISVLEEFNKWRRGDETIPQPEPFKIGGTIDDAVRLLRTLETELAAAEAEVQALQNNNLYHRGHSAGYAEATDDCEAELFRMANRAEKAEAECLEQARLLGMSGEREADLLGKLERAEKLKKLWKEFITLMKITEESDSGNKFNPNKISSCRALDGRKLNEILVEARRIVFNDRNT